MENILVLLQEWTQRSAIDKLLTSRMIKASLSQNSNQRTESLLDNVPSPDDSSCWSFNDPHPPADLLVHGNTRNHVRSNLEVTCKMVGQNQTSELLAAAKEGIQFGLHWPCKIKF